MEMKSADVSVGSSTVSVVSSGTVFGSAAGSVSNSTCGPEFIITIRLNRRNYAPWAKSVEVYMMAKGIDTYLTKAPPDRKDPSWATWKVEDDRIRLRMWNIM